MFQFIFAKERQAEFGNGIDKMEVPNQVVHQSYYGRYKLSTSENFDNFLREIGKLRSDSHKLWVGFTFFLFLSIPLSSHTELSESKVVFHFSVALASQMSQYMT